MMSDGANVLSSSQVIDPKLVRKKGCRQIFFTPALLFSVARALHLL
jgi:hypothetical protein